MTLRYVYIAACFVIGNTAQNEALACDLVVASGEGDTVTTISLNDGSPFHSTISSVTDARCIEVPNDLTPTILALWNEQASDESIEPWYGITLDGVEFVRITSTSYMLNLRFAQFDPLLSSPATPAELESDTTSRLHIVQFMTQPLEVFLQRISQLGGMPHEYIPYHAYLVK